MSSGRCLQTTPVFDSYWRFAALRQDLFLKRVMGDPPPWTEDEVLAAHRFTNAYRAADRVSQYFIHNVLYRGGQTCEEIFFRALLFKFFNRIETWEHLERALGMISWRGCAFDTYAQVLDAVLARGERIYSAAYIMPSPALGSPRGGRE